MQRKMTIEIRNETPAFNESFISTIDLPALPLALRDAEQRARLPRDPDPPPEIVVISCPELPELIDCRLDSPSTEEMNFLASRMEQLTDTQMTAFRALCAVHFANDPTFEEPVPIWQLINMTYGLDDVIVMGGIESDEDIADFVIANGLNEDVAAVPESSLYLLDKKMIGKLQRQNDNGVILDGSYVVTEGYEIPEIYDGAVLPNRDRSLDLAVFRLLVSESPVNDSIETLKSAEWIKLPISPQVAQQIALWHNEGCMEDCVCYRFESAIPQIGEYFFQDMQEFQLLNEIAEIYLKMPDISKIRFKAALEHDKPNNLHDVMDIMENVREYSIDPDVADEDDFFKKYMAFFTDTRIDSRWYSTVHAYDEGAALLERMGGAVTPYGACSARGKTLVEIVSYDEPQEENNLEEEHTEENNMTMGGM